MTAEMYDQAAPRELSGKRRGLVKNGHTAPPKLVASRRFEPRNERDDRRGQIFETADDVAQAVLAGRLAQIAKNFVRIFGRTLDDCPVEQRPKHWLIANQRIGVEQRKRTDALSVASQHFRQSFDRRTAALSQRIVDRCARRFLIMDDWRKIMQRRKAL